MGKGFPALYNWGPRGGAGHFKILLWRGGMEQKEVGGVDRVDEVDLVDRVNKCHPCESCLPCPSCPPSPLRPRLFPYRLFRNRSASSVFLRVIWLFRTAIAIAFSSPTITTIFFPRVMAV